MRDYRTDICPADSNRIGYVILPMPPSFEDLEWMRRSAEKHKTNLVLLSGMDWNNDMTPWPAPSVFSCERNFEGRADTFLQVLLKDVIPSVESVLQRNNMERSLIGLSLSGLFSLWASCHTDAFSSIASISGSLWYDGFIEWLMWHVPYIAYAYLLLGDREKNTRNPRMAVVEEKTEIACRILQEKGVDTFYELESGTHFSPYLPRLEKAFNHLFV